MSEIKAIGKEQRNKLQGFNFRGIDDIYNHCQDIMARHGVFTVPTIKNRFHQEIQTKAGGRAWLRVNEFVFRFYAEDGSFIEAHADGESIDSGDKSSNKCAAGAHKYALLQTFCIPTEELEDPDKHSHEMIDPDISANHLFELENTLGKMSEEDLKKLEPWLEKTYGVKLTELAKLKESHFKILIEIIKNRVG